VRLLTLTCRDALGELETIEKHWGVSAGAKEQVIRFTDPKVISRLKHAVELSDRMTLEHMEGVAGE
jgi:hypothetical protein